MEENVILTMRGICKEFPGVRALNNVDFTLREGEIHALMGENGAGKSTLVKCLTGVYIKDKGEIRIKGIDTSTLDMKDLINIYINKLIESKYDYESGMSR